MPLLTSIQKTKFVGSLKAYKSKYLRKKFFETDESGTRIMVISFLTEVLWYEELEEIKTEYAIRGTYADYVIQLEKKQKMVIEVKAIQLELNENHIRQALGYAANEWVDWVLLTNAKRFVLYRVIFWKPIDFKKVFDHDLMDAKSLEKSIDHLELITKKCFSTWCLDDYWQRFQAIEPVNLYEHLYRIEIIRSLRKILKQEKWLLFSEEDILESVYNVVIRKIESPQPRKPKEAKQKKNK